MKSILHIESFVTSITIWVPFRVAKRFGAMGKPLRSQVFAPPCSFDCDIVQQAAALPDITLQMAWRADDKRSVEDGGAFAYLLEKYLGPAPMVPIRLYFVPSEKRMVKKLKRHEWELSHPSVVSPRVVR
jgi:hypothetical protein